MKVKAITDFFLNAGNNPFRAMQLLPKGIGLLLGLEMLNLWPDLPAMYEADGIVAAEISSAWHNGSLFSIRDLLQRYPYLQIHYFSGVYILLCLLLLWPRAVRPACLVLLFAHQAFFLIDQSWTYGADYLAQTGLLICLIFAPSCNKQAISWTSIGLRLLQGQLILVYFFGGLGKALGATWWNGEAIWKAIQQPYAGHLIRIPDAWASYRPLWMLVGIAVVLLELSYGFALFRPRSRKGIMIATIAMHLGIALCMGLYHFAGLMIWYNLCAWHYPYQHIAEYNHSPLGSCTSDTSTA